MYDIGGHPVYRINIPPPENWEKLCKFLGASIERLTKYELYHIAPNAVGDIWSAKPQDTVLFNVCEPNDIAIGLICAELFDTIEWRRVFGQVYFIGHGWHGMPDALYYTLRTARLCLLPPEDLKPVINLFIPQRPDAEIWLQKYPDAMRYFATEPKK